MQQAPTYLNSIKASDEHKNFFFQQFQLACLGQFSYYIESKQEAVVIDPIRDVDDYINLAKSRNANIKYVILTHIHADFIGGHLEIQRKTGAEIVLGNKAKTEYAIKGLEDNDQLQIGEISLRALHTPGHTLESTCFVLVSEGKDYAIFTGDTLFLQEVGRPDLAVADGKISKEDLAGLLFESLRQKIQPLSDDVIVYPGHGAGSSCGKSIGAGTSCTIGNQKKLNYALSDINKQEFVRRLTDISAPPQYYFFDAKVVSQFIYIFPLKNQTGPSDVEKVRQQVLKALTYQEVKELLDDTIIIDSREDLKEGGIEGAINISFSTTFASYVGLLIKPTQKLIVVSSPGKEELTITRLLRIGYENILGYLEGGFEAWKSNGGQVFDAQIVDIKDFTKTDEGRDSVYVDVRNIPEFETIGIMENSILLPLPVLEQNIDKLPKDKVLHIFCRMGPRAKTAQSILRRYGFQHFKLIQNGGLQEIAKENNLQIAPYQ